jgi:hypothetical protein
VHERTRAQPYATGSQGPQLTPPIKFVTITESLLSAPPSGTAGTALQGAKPDPPEMAGPQHPPRPQASPRFQADEAPLHCYITNSDNEMSGDTRPRRPRHKRSRCPEPPTVCDVVTNDRDGRHKRRRCEQRAQTSDGASQRRDLPKAHPLSWLTPEPQSINDLIRQHSHTRLFVPPIEWTNVHLDCLDINFWEETGCLSTLASSAEVAFAQGLQQHLYHLTSREMGFESRERELGTILYYWGYEAVKNKRAKRSVFHVCRAALVERWC